MLENKGLKKMFEDDPKIAAGAPKHFPKFLKKCTNCFGFSKDIWKSKGIGQWKVTVQCSKKYIFLGMCINK